MWLNNLVYYLGTVIIVTALIFAFSFRKCKKPKYFKFVFVVIFCGLLISINTFFFRRINIYSQKVGIIIQSLILIVQFLNMFLVFYFQSIAQGLKKWVLLLSVISLLSGISVIVILIKKDMYFPQSIIQNLMIITYSVFYFLSILKGRPDVVLVKSPSFWLVLGMFFWATVSFPIYCLYLFIPMTAEYSEISNKLFSFSNVALIVMYILFIKSYLCLKLLSSLQ